ncbi:uncharacterized protein [Dermacentor andersoni]|uniref:uncharacterized protein n=1 Tax=Dermacentor andersoni TaxID=34620 RepID=UPI003B3B225D
MCHRTSAGRRSLRSGLHREQLAPCLLHCAGASRAFARRGPPLACRCRHNIFWRRGWDSRSGSDRSPGKPTSFAHLEAAGGGDWTDARRASALVSALGREGQRKYFADEEQEAARQLTGAASPSSEAARQSTGAASTSSDAVPPASEFPRLLERLDRLFAASTNVLAERHEFTSRKQFEGEGFLEFVTALKEKAVQCNFGTAYNERVRDQIIHGVANVSVREKLLAHGETLSLDKAEEIGRSLEALHRANRAFGSENVRRIEASQLGVPSTGQDGRLLPGSRQDGRRSPGGHEDGRLLPRSRRDDGLLPRGRRDDGHFAHGFSGNRGACDRCGSTKHIATHRNCPARNRRCNACHTLGHFASVCRKTRTVQHVSSAETLSSTSAGQPSASVLTVSAFETKKDLEVPVVVNGVAMRLPVDTEASASLMTAEDFGKHFGRQHRLSKTAVDLKNFSKQRIDIQGLFQATVQFFQRSCSVTFHVTTTGTSLLGLDAIQRLGIQIDGTSLTCRLPSLPSVQSPTGVPPGFHHRSSDELGLVNNFVHRIHRQQDAKPTPPVPTPVAFPEVTAPLSYAEALARPPPPTFGPSPSVVPLRPAPHFVQPRSGRLHTDADALSRSPVLTESDAYLSAVDQVLSLPEGCDMASEQRKDACALVNLFQAQALTRIPRSTSAARATGGEGYYFFNARCLPYHRLLLHARGRGSGD